MRIQILKHSSYYEHIHQQHQIVMSTYLITGATSGLGLQVALRLARQGGHQLVLPVRNASRGAALVQALHATDPVRVSTPIIDLSSLRSVAAFLNTFNADTETKLDGMLLNAGVQSSGQLGFTQDGIESSFAVNHLASFFLAQGLLEHLKPGAFVGWTSSGTHDPNETAARMGGFRGARYSSATQLALGECEHGTSAAQACKDAYATSKLCNIVCARAFAERYPGKAQFFSFDPGLMPGTGLSREHGAAAQWVWRNVLPRLAPLLPGTSTPAKSSAILVQLLTGQLRASYNGAYFRHTGAQEEPAAPATEAWVAQDLITTSHALVAPFLAAAQETA